MNETPSLQSKKILLVDSMELALKMEEEILRRSGVAIRTARSGSEALVLVREDRPDLVFLEFAMPEMSGEECCQAIKNDPQLRGIPVILMLGSPTTEIINRAFAADCEDVVTKPLNQAEILHKLTGLLEVPTRKLRRLNVATPVTISHREKTWQGEIMNLNCRGLLLKSQEIFPENSNYQLTFTLSPADQTLQVWGRQERQVPPGDPKNPSDQYLVLFRFLNLPEKTALRIDQLAEMQMQQTGQSAAREAAKAVSADFNQMREKLGRKVDFYQNTLLAISKDVNRLIPEFSSAENTQARMLTMGLKPWEKSALQQGSEEDGTVLQAAAFRLKFAMDLKYLMSLKQLSENEIEALKAMQNDYFGAPESVMEELQTLINTKMAQADLERMKQLNQTKTDTFKEIVAAKAQINRLLDPKAASEASQFQYQPTDEDRYQASTIFEKPKPIEETKKPKDDGFGFKAPLEKQGPPWGQITAVCILLILLVAALNYAPKLALQTARKNSRGIPTIRFDFKGKYPIQEVKEADSRHLVVYMNADWNRLDPFQKQELAKKIWGEVAEKGYPSMGIYNANLEPVADVRPGQKLRFMER